jgi:hypothetical protein
MAKDLEPSRKGGVREGSGRKPGSANRLSRSLANELNEKGLDGLSLMLDNAIFWKTKVEELQSMMTELGAKAAGLLDKVSKDDKDGDASAEAASKVLSEFNKTAAFFLAARDKLQDCAVNMAPYTNPRLQSIMVEKSSVHTEITMVMSPSADDKERAYRDGSTTIVPFVRRSP